MMEKANQQQLDHGTQLTVTLIRECALLVGRQELTADNCAKALLAAAVNLGLQSAPRATVCAWLRGVADELERGALTPTRDQVN